MSHGTLYTPRGIRCRGMGDIMNDYSNPVLLPRQYLRSQVWWTKCEREGNTQQIVASNIFIWMKGLQWPASESYSDQTDREQRRRFRIQHAKRQLLQFEARQETRKDAFEIRLQPWVSDRFRRNPTFISQKHLAFHTCVRGETCESSAFSKQTRTDAMQRQHEHTYRRKKPDLDLDPRHEPANMKAMPSKEFTLKWMQNVQLMSLNIPIKRHNREACCRSPSSLFNMFILLGGTSAAGPEGTQSNTSFILLNWICKTIQSLALTILTIPYLQRNEKSPKEHIQINNHPRARCGLCRRQLDKNRKYWKKRTRGTAVPLD